MKDPILNYTEQTASLIEEELERLYNSVLTPLVADYSRMMANENIPKPIKDNREILINELKKCIVNLTNTFNQFENSYKLLRFINVMQEKTLDASKKTN